MDVFVWMDMHNPNEKGITMSERARRSAIVKELCEKAKTRRAYLNNSKYRGSMGPYLLNRLIDASKDFAIPITKGTGKRHGCSFFISIEK